jgi:hypothetical protein
VADAAGRPVSAVVFAADTVSDVIVAVAHTRSDGSFALQVPSRKHFVGIFGARWRILTGVKTGPDTMMVTVAPADIIAPNPADTRLPIDVLVGQKTAGTPQILRGRIADETGAPLAEVAVEATLPDGKVAGRAFSAADGAYVLPLMAGRYGLTARAVGLKVGRATRLGRRIDMVMSVAGEPQTVRIFQRHVLTFRIGDSIDPEYTPPSVVKAWLSYAYNVRTSGEPLTAAQKRRTKKYWWLELLRYAPRNPAALADTAPYDPLRLPELPVDGPAEPRRFERAGEFSGQAPPPTNQR